MATDNECQECQRLQGIIQAVTDLHNEVAKERNELKQQNIFLQRRHREQTEKVNGYVVANADLERELQAARKDTARLTKLEDLLGEGNLELCNKVRFADQEEPISISHDTGYWWASTLREAIDAARAASSDL